MARRRLLLALLLALPVTTTGCIDFLSNELEESREDSQDGDAAPDEVDAGVGFDNSTADDGPTGDASPTNPTLVLPGTTPTPPAATAPPATVTPPPATTPPAATPPPATTPPTATPPPPTTTTTPPPTTTTPPTTTPPTTTPPTTTPPTPTPPPPAAWPREGSYVRYAVQGGQSFSGSPQGWDEYANLMWTYVDGDWRGVCEGDRHSTDHEGVTTVRHFRVEYATSDPPHWPLFNTRNVPAVGEDVEAWNTRGCRIESDTWTYAGVDTHDAVVNGQSRTVATHRAESGPDDVPFNFRTEWSSTTGLVLYWSHSRSPSQAPSSTAGHLIDTDAPLWT